jgi:hypothetical protein
MGSSNHDLRVPVGCAALTQSDTVADPLGPFRAIWVNVAGNLKVTFQDGTTGTFTVASASRFEGRISRVWSTGTTATGLTGLY